MKKSLLIGLVVALVLSFGSFALAGTAPGTGIKGTFHDLSTNGLGGVPAGDANDQTNGLNRICIYCHAPHNTYAPEATINTYRPLWNHLKSTRTAFTMYTNSTTGDTPQSGMHMSQAMAYLAASIITVPGGVSMLCLSCHDGTVGTNAYGTSSTGIGSIGANNKMIATRAKIGGNGDLSNHHPIGFPYDAAAANDVEILPITTAITGAATNGPATIADLLWGSAATVECVSCHDVHNTKNTGERFLWVSDRSSGLCLTCHDKGGTP